MGGLLSLLNNLSSWSNKTRTFAGLSYIAFRLTWDADKYIGIPKIQALVEGRKISTYDSGSNETTGVFTSNPAFCLLDYLTNTRYGKGIDIADIDIPSLTADKMIQNIFGSCIALLKIYL